MVSVWKIENAVLEDNFDSVFTKFNQTVLRMNCHFHSNGSHLPSWTVQFHECERTPFADHSGWNWLNYVKWFSRYWHFRQNWKPCSLVMLHVKVKNHRCSVFRQYIIWTDLYIRVDVNFVRVDLNCEKVYYDLIPLQIFSILIYLNTKMGVVGLCDGTG